MQLQRITNYYTFDPDIIANCLVKNDWAGCWEYICEIIESLSSVKNYAINAMMQKDIQAEDKKLVIQEFGKLLGEVIFTLLSDPATRIPDKNFFRLMGSHETLHNLFYLFGQLDVSPIISSLLSQNKTLSDGQQKKLLLLIDMHADLDIVHILKRTDTVYRMPAVVAYLNYNAIYNENVYQNKIKIYALRHDLAKSYNEMTAFSMVASAYFTSSYLDIPDRHIIKDNINKSVQLYIGSIQREIKKSKAFLEKTWSIEGSDKPKMIVLMDYISKDHSMTRSWSEWIRSLSTEFDVTVMVQDTKITSDAEGIFEKIKIFQSIYEMIAFCQLMAPEVCIFPAVGMTYPSIIGANMRLAPLQIMGLGHPATSYSPYIDFVYGPEEMYHADAFPTDRYFIDNSPYKFFPILSKEEILSMRKLPVTTASKDTVRVAIVGTIIKISSPFIQMLNEIEAESEFDIHFEFSIMSVGIDTLCLQKFLKQNFKNITYHGASSYRDFLSRLRDADVILNPFPFGHTNTLIDTMLMGKPCVGLQGVEPASKTEQYILRILGLEDRFSAKTIAEYKEKFKQIVKELKGGTFEPIDIGDVYDRLYADHVAFDFGKIIKWVYYNRKSLMNSSERAFKIPQM